ncbi:MAG TPA: hypothetical protein DHU59_09685 [Clostridiales bacterium]|nr:hypothetical protein [Clostridiales bacterium]
MVRRICMIDNSKRDKILEASLDEFAEYGYDKASTDRISEKAGVSKGLIFHYFGSKDNLYMIIINKCIDDFFDKFNKMKFDDSEFIQKFIQITKMKYNFFVNNPMHYRILTRGFYNAPKKLQEKLKFRYSELKQIGLNILVDMIKDLPIKENISADDILAVFESITGLMESKYLPYFTEDIDNFEEIYDGVIDEYIKLINIVLYGILYQN